MLFSVEQAFVGKEEIRAPLKTPAWEANHLETVLKMTQLSRTLLVNMHLKCLSTKRRVNVLLGILILFVSFQGLLGISIRPTRSFTRCETITGMDTLKMM